VSPTRTALRRLELLLALAAPLLTWVAVGLNPQWYPTWLVLGPVTLGAAELPATAFGLVVALTVLVTWRETGRPRRTRLATGALAALVVLTAVWAAATLNLGSSGLYVAGVLPMGLGLLLALVVLAREARAALAGGSTGEDAETDHETSRRG
jgi:MFS superfamily sulfate permease-like transporter